MRSGVAPSAFFAQELAKEQDAIYVIEREARHHIRRISDFRDSIAGNPEDSAQITYALSLVFVLFFVGVIAPLAFMPLATGVEPKLSFGAFFAALSTIKGVLLTALSAAFSLIVTMFFFINVRMKYSPADVSELDRYSVLGAYSRYFGVMEENRAARPTPEEESQSDESNSAEER